MPAHTLTDNAVRKLRRALADRPGSTGGGAGGGVPVSYNRYAAPFTVRWAASLAQGESSEGAGDATSGEWIIWLPPGDLLHVSGETVDVTANLEAAGGDYPEGWYVLATDDEPIIDRDEGGALYLSLSGVFSGAASGDAIKICDAAVDASTGARTVKQYVSSSIIIGSGGAPMPFDLKGEIETSEDGTQKRLKVYYRAEGAKVLWNASELTPADTLSGWVLAYASTWVSAEGSIPTAKIWLYIETTFSQELADSTYRYDFEGTWEVFEEHGQMDYGAMDVTNDGACYLYRHIPIGEVSVNGDKVTVAQYFHGVLVLQDTSFIWDQDGGGGGGGGGGDTTDTGCYAIDSSNKLINQYFIRGGVVETTGFTGDITGYKGLILALKISATPGGSATLAAYATVSELATASEDPDYIVTPLYWFNSDGTVKVDFRNAPRAQTVEIL